METVPGYQLLYGDFSTGQLDLGKTSGTVTALNDFNVDGDASFDGTAISCWATTLSDSLAVSGATTIGSTLGVTGATTLSSTLAVSGAATFSDDATISGTLAW